MSSNRDPICKGCTQAITKGKGSGSKCARRDCYRWTHGIQGTVKAEYFGLGRIQNPHIRLKDFETKPNNNILERLNGTFSERTKVVRSFDSGIGAEEFATGMATYYNYIRPHQGIGGMVPAQLANIPINLTGNRWETMIRLAAK